MSSGVRQFMSGRTPWTIPQRYSTCQRSYRDWRLRPWCRMGSWIRWKVAGLTDNKSTLVERRKAVLTVELTVSRKVVMAMCCRQRMAITYMHCHPGTSGAVASRRCIFAAVFKKRGDIPW